MDSELFRKLMALYGDTNGTLAEYLKLSEQSVCNKINENGTEFKLGEIAKIKHRYNLDNDMVDRVFFAPKVSKLDTNANQGIKTSSGIISISIR